MCVVFWRGVLCVCMYMLVFSVAVVYVCEKVHHLARLD